MSSQREIKWNKEESELDDFESLVEPYHYNGLYDHDAVKLAEI